MLRIVLEVDSQDVTGAKEHLAMYMDEFADTRVVEVRVVPDKKLN